MQVAIIGTPGSGKTILTAVLSRYFAGHHDSVYMNPKAGRKYKGNSCVTISTISYISEVLEILRSGQWPGITPQDQKYELEFELHIEGSVYEMKLLDSAGEDLKKIGTTYDENKLTDFQKKLFKCLMAADTVIIIVNLDDFADARSLSARDECEDMLKETVDNLAQRSACRYILVCFTAYDKYEATMAQYGKDADISITEYLRRELPMFYRSCKAAKNKVIDECDGASLIKHCRIKYLAVAPVVAQKPDPEINPDRWGKPPVGFDVTNEMHCLGMREIAMWLHDCDERDLEWAKGVENAKREKQRYDIILYRVFPILAGISTGVLAGLSLTKTLALFINSLLFVIPIGAVIGFLAGDKLKILITKKDGLIFKIKRSDEDEQQEEPATSRPTRTGGTAATSGSENFD